MKYFKSGFIIFIFILLVVVNNHYSIYEKIIDHALGQSINNERALDYARGDIDGDGEDELVLITKRLFSKYGREVLIFNKDNEEIYRKDFKDLKPWKVALGDIDGNALDEVSIGVYKETIFHPIMAKRPFIYSYEDGGLYPKWRGSRLARPFTDYIFQDIDGSGLDEIVSIEILEDGSKLINTYKWKGFGFEGYRESKSFKDIRNLRLHKGKIYIDVEDKDHTYKAQVQLIDGNIVVKR